MENQRVKGLRWIDRIPIGGLAIVPSCSAYSAISSSASFGREGWHPGRAR